MELTDAEIKQHIADGRIRAITLDTSIFDGNGNRFERGLLARLKQFKDTSVEFVVSDAVIGEVRNHVIREAQDAKSKTNAALKLVGASWQVDNSQRDAAISALFGTESSEQLADRRIANFMKETDFTVLESEGRLNVNKLLESYFSSKPPFGITAAKKSEFPDAIALQSLENWADDEDLQILVVSKDGDWKKYCTSARRLVVVEDLALALSYFHANEEVACGLLANRLQSGELGLDQELTRLAQLAVDRLNIIPEVSSGYFYQAEMGDVEVQSIELINDTYATGPFRVVDKPEDHLLSVEAEIAITISASAYLSFYIEDSFDKDQINIGGAVPSTEETLHRKVLLTFEGDLASAAKLVEADIEAPKATVYVNFGDVGPDWDEE